jgi:ferrochelatase
VPIGFVSDHMEVKFDLDVEAAELAERIGLRIERAATAGNHPRFVAMVRELFFERDDGTERPALGTLGPRPDTCAGTCCRRPA